MTDAAGPMPDALPAQGGSGGLAVLRQVVATARAVAGADAAAILLHDRARGRFVPTTPRVAVGLDEGWLRGQGLEAAQALALRAVEAGTVLDLPDTAAAPALDYPLLAGGVRPGAVCAAPLVVEGTVVGVLELYEERPRGAPADAQLLRAFAAHAGIAIENGLLQAQLDALTRPRENGGWERHDGMIQNIYAATLLLGAAAADAPDREMAGQLCGIVDQLSGVIAGLRAAIQDLQAPGL